MKFTTISRHLRRVLRKVSDCDITTTAEDRAIACAILAIEKIARREYQLQHLGIDHIDGNICNNSPANLRVVKLSENAPFPKGP